MYWLVKQLLQLNRYLESRLHTTLVLPLGPVWALFLGRLPPEKPKIL